MSHRVIVYVFCEGCGKELDICEKQGTQTSSLTQGKKNERLNFICLSCQEKRNKSCEQVVDFIPLTNLSEDIQ